MRTSLLPQVGLNKIQRECARIGLKDEVVLEPLAKDPPSLGYVTAAVDFYMKPKQRVEARQGPELPDSQHKLERQGWLILHPESDAF